MEAEGRCDASPSRRGGEGQMKLKPFKAWLLFDFDGTYVPSIHTTRERAVSERDHVNLRDAKWRIIRVVVRRVDTRAKNGR